MDRLLKVPPLPPPMILAVLLGAEAQLPSPDPRPPRTVHRQGSLCVRLAAAPCWSVGLGNVPSPCSPFWDGAHAQGLACEARLTHRRDLCTAVMLGVAGAVALPPEPCPHWGRLWQGSQLPPRRLPTRVRNQGWVVGPGIGRGQRCWARECEAAQPHRAWAGAAGRAVGTGPIWHSLQ